MEPVSRARTPRAAPEKEMLGAFLDYCRATLLVKPTRHNGHADIMREMIDGVTGD